MADGKTNKKQSSAGQRAAQVFRTNRNKILRAARAKRRAERKKADGTWEPYGSLKRSATYKKHKTVGDVRRKARRFHRRQLERSRQGAKVQPAPSNLGTP